MSSPLDNGSRPLVQKLWHYCNVLRDDGLSYGDYVEQLTNLLFLKMIHERTEPPCSEPPRLPSRYAWPSLTSKSGMALDSHYSETLTALGQEAGLLGLMFRHARNRIRDPQKLQRLIIDLIDRETWSTSDSDIKGDIYEGLLERNATDTKSGAGQYFTPRALTHAMVDVMRPRPGETIGDPAAGTGGFIVAAHDYLTRHYNLGSGERAFLRDHTFYATELVDGTARLCAMNLFLHGIGGGDLDATPPIEVRDALVAPAKQQVDIVLANPPFGRKSSLTLASADTRLAPKNGTALRTDFWTETSNKQLNFLQHIVSMMKVGGRAAVVLPDNVLFEGGAGELVRRRLLHECDVHAMLRLPNGIFYAQSVKASVLFFTRQAPSAVPATKALWVYDLRTNQHFTLKTRSLQRSDLEGFVQAYRPGRPPTERIEVEHFRSWTYDELTKRPSLNLDVWASVKDAVLTDPSELPAPELVARQIIANAAAGIEAFTAVADELARLSRPSHDGIEDSVAS